MSRKWAANCLLDETIFVIMYLLQWWKVSKVQFKKYIFKVLILYLSTFYDYVLYYSTTFWIWCKSKRNWTVIYVYFYLGLWYIGCFILFPWTLKLSSFLAHVATGQTFCFIRGIVLACQSFLCSHGVSVSCYSSLQQSGVRLMLNSIKQCLEAR